MSTYTIALQTIASLTGIATSTSMIIAYRQLRLATRNSQITFEDALAREFRQVASRVPLKALLGRPLTDEEHDAALPVFYWYFDLTNEQVFLRRHGRVGDLTWASWQEGICATMRRPAFARAWRDLTADVEGVFSDLRRYLEEGFERDPKAWPPGPSDAGRRALRRPEPREPIRPVGDEPPARTATGARARRARARS